MKILLLHRTLANDYTFNRLYTEPLKQFIEAETFNQAELYYSQGVKKVKADDKKQWLNSIGSKLDIFDVILVSDGDYFKTIAGTSKAEGTIGNLYDSQYTKAKIMYVPSVSACTYHPDKNLPKLQLAFKTIKDLAEDQYQERGTDIVHFHWHPKKIVEIQVALAHLKHFPALTIDIEAKSLAFVDAGIYTISFAWDEHNYISFPVDALSNPEDRNKVKELLKEFFNEYRGKKIIHKSNYDVTVMNYVLYQNEDVTDIQNQVNGLNKFFGENCDEIEDTLIITYLATNSTAGNTLGLKELASEFAGDWAVDVSDVTTVPLDDLLKYNGIDCLSTWYVYKKYYPMMVKDEQEDLYKTFMLPTLKANIRCQLNGLPIDMNKVHKLDKELQKEQFDLEIKLRSYPEIKKAEWTIAEQVTEKRNAKLKKKQTTVEENFLPINFGSNKQLQTLVYEVMALPIIERTDNKEPAVGKKVLKNLINHTDNQQHKEILQTLCDLTDVNKIESAFIPAFKEAPKSKQGHKLHGYFNLGGTVSGRLSSANINLQQLPATGSRFAKPVKKLFTSTQDWIFCGIDFNALEARIDALTTKDPEKLKVFTDGFDTHCLNAYIAFGSQMESINPNSKDSINSIKDLYPDLRQKAKSYGFSLQYGGQEHTLIKNVGLSPSEAKEAYENYHKTYWVSSQWKNQHIKSACEKGYVTTGFGLRVRTPILKNTIYSENMTNIAAAEARTAGNALGQGWGVLNDRAMNEVLERVDNEGKTSDILPVAKIHDACYYLVKNDIDTILWLNQAVVKASKWQDHPDIYHPEVGLSGQLDLFYPDWSNPITLPENCTEKELIELVNKVKS